MSDGFTCRATLYAVLPLAMLVLTVFFSGSSAARPDMTPTGPNIADTGSAYYHFTVRLFDSADGKRHYQVWTGVPDKAPPVAGYPVLWLLDGNAVMAHLSDPLLKQISAGTPPVLIAVGYQTPLPFDTQARAYDYTPQPQPLTGIAPPSGRKMGGSASFRQLLETTIAPQAEKNLPLNTRQRALWGHSYAGLFVLDSYRASSFFHRFYAASPSLGQGYFYLLNAAEAAAKRQSGTVQLTLMEGDGDPPRRQQSGTPDVLSRVRQSVATLRQSGATAYWRFYPGLAHGQMFGASLESVLSEVSSGSAATN